MHDPLLEWLADALVKVYKPPPTRDPSRAADASTSWLAVVGLPRRLFKRPARVAAGHDTADATAGDEEQAAEAPRVDADHAAHVIPDDEESEASEKAKSCASGPPKKYDPPRKRAVAKHLSWCVQQALAAGVPPGLIRSRLLEWRTQFGWKITGHETLEDALDAFETSLRVRSRVRPHIALLNAATEHWYIVAPVLGLIATVVFGASYRSFYDQLGLTPSDVGLKPAQFVAGTVGGAIVLFVTTTVVVAGSVAPCLAVLPAAGARMDRDKRYRFSPRIGGSAHWGIIAAAWLVSYATISIASENALFGAVIASVVLVWALAIALPAGWIRAAMSALTGVTLALPFLTNDAISPWVLIGLLLGPLDVALTAIDRRRRAGIASIEVPAVLSRGRELRILAVSIGFLGLIVVSFALPLLASDAASDIHNGREVTSVDVFSVPLLDVEARAVTVRWKNPSVAMAGAVAYVPLPNLGGVTAGERRSVPEIPGCVFYLGHDDSGTIVLYQVERAESLATPGEPPSPIIRQRALRVEQGDVMLVGGNRQCNVDGA